MYPFSQRSRLLALQSRTSKPVAYPYLISDPLPADITHVCIQIVSHDQGWSSTPQNGNWTWFEGSVLRPVEKGFSGPVLSDNLPLVREHPEGFAHTFEVSGWHFVDCTEHQDAILDHEKQTRFSIKLCENTSSQKWQTHHCGSSREGVPDEHPPPLSRNKLLHLIRGGDRIVIWARACFPGWRNYVASARLQIYTPGSSHATHEIQENTIPQRMSKVLDLSTRDYVLLWEEKEAKSVELEDISDSSATNRVANADNDLVVHNAVCDGCEQPIYGIRHKCMSCPDFDYCDSCFKDSQKRHSQHNFIMFDRPMISQLRSNETLTARQLVTRDENETHPVQSEAILLNELEALHTGGWIICPHDCRIQEHEHPEVLCGLQEDPSTATTQSGHITKTRAVSNPCSHYSAMRSDLDLRLLRICPSRNHDDKVQLVLLPARGPISNVSYLALSYCWGDLQETCEIMLNHVHRLPNAGTGAPGICLRQTFNVTCNLHRALQSIACNAATGIRHGTALHPNWWVDAICINQHNKKERAQQVARMGEIYSRAALVNIWLDLPLRLSEAAFEVCNGLSATLKRKFGESATGFSMTSEHDNFLADKGPIDHDVCADVHPSCIRVLESLAGLFANPWFHRIWVIQEVCRANGHAMVMASPHKYMHFADLLIGFRYLRSRHSTRPDGSKILAMPDLWHGLIAEMGNNRRKTGISQDPTTNRISIMPMRPQRIDEEMPELKLLGILTLFNRALQFQATDPRDKLFALYGLARETFVSTSIPAQLSVTYENDHVQVFMAFSRYCIAHYRNLTLFDGVKRSARINFYAHNTDVLPAEYNFPPPDYPTWALWHACKPAWTADVAHPEQYLDRSVFDVLRDSNIDKSLGDPLILDPSIVDCDPDPLHLAVNGKRLDEIEAVVRVSSGASTYKAALIPTMLTERPLQKMWDYVLQIYRTQTDDVELNQNLAKVHESEDDLFENFLRTTCCDSTLTHGGLERHGLYANDSTLLRIAEDDGLMIPIMSYWLDYSLAPSSEIEQVLEDAHLPPIARKTCERLIASKKLSEGDAMQFNASLHHILGQCFFVTRRAYLGLGPVGTRCGDSLIAVRGARLACVLRSRGDETIDWSVERSGWLLVGTGYVYAWMSGSFVKEMVKDVDGLDDLYVLV